jgi:hypothetical protein
MSRLDDLIRHYDQFVSLPWEQGLSGLQKVWFVVYDKEDERRLRVQIGEFELATKKAGRGWKHVDLTDAFARWMSAHDYREDYFEEPDFLDDMALEPFHQSICTEVREALENSSTDENTVVTIQGIASLFGFTKVSRLIRDLETAIRGRLLVFFPGEYENNNYRLLDARDGWNYMAVPITAHSGNGADA